jgi:pimeloyl-ACP methyl ester carboxylesterase
VGAPPETTFPSTPDHPQWQVFKRTYFYNPAPTLRRLTTPTLAIWGDLDNNITANRNRPAWDVALKAAGNRDYSLVVLPKANHDMLEANVGSNAEMKTLRRFVPDYFSTVKEWVGKHVRGYRE